MCIAGDSGSHDLVILRRPIFFNLTRTTLLWDLSTNEEAAVEPLSVAQLGRALESALLSQGSVELALIYLINRYEMDLIALKARLFDRNSTPPQGEILALRKWHRAHQIIAYAAERCGPAWASIADKYMCQTAFFGFT